MQEVAHFFRPKPGVINTAFSFNENLILRSDQPLIDRIVGLLQEAWFYSAIRLAVHVFCKIVIERAGLKCNFMGSNQVSLLVFCLIVLKM
ncbi:uncharacterized protein LOC133717093 isoform X12 [Rosa rugosa]|uniref:uncharacterized protein LOC133717093 isoform X12 n=2 Tax=Rosa rugosa TaxID=74645 RepID=UPI002B402DA0|nr:uncharacterized protein LOC133717093 isoform X12 [Rosa rugosa]